MSEYSSLILVKIKNTNKISKFLKKTNIDSYLFKANSEWVASVINKEDVNLSEFCVRISNALKAYVINFCNSEEYGWGYEIFNEKGKLAWADINYELDNFQDNFTENFLENANLPELRKIAYLSDEENANNISELERFFNGCSEDIFTGINVFKKLFGFENIFWVNFESFSQTNDDKLNSNGILHITTNKSENKKINFKKLILTELKDDLEKLGFIYQKNNIMSGDYAFFKYIDGYQVGLQIYIVQNMAGICLKTQYFEDDIFSLTTGKQKLFCTESENEIKVVLQETLTFFKAQGIEIINKNLLKSFNAFEIYNTKVDEFFNKNSYIRISTDEIILVGGKIVYSNSLNKIIFSHTPFFVGIGCTVIDNDGNERIINIDSAYKNNSVFYSFYNREEYEDILDAFIDAIVKEKLIY